MADRKISELTALTAPAAGDYLPIVDISEAAAVSRNKRITIEELFRGIPLGTAAAPSIAIEGDENTGIYSPGADQLSVTTGGTERLRIDAAGQIEAVSLGTAAAPTYSFTTDPNTGIYSPGADQVAISTNGTGRLFIDSSGRLGLGTSSPSTTLHVNGDGTFGSTTPTIIKANGDINFASNYNGVLSKNSTYVYLGSTNNAVALWPNSGTNANPGLIVDTSNRVGIGTTAPGDYSNDANNLVVQDASGNGGITIRTPTSNAGAIFFADGVSADPGAAANRGMLRYDHSNDSMQFWTAGNNERARIDSSGRLGLGTSSPQSAFHILQSAANTLQIIQTGSTSTTIGNVYGSVEFRSPYGTGNNAIGKDAKIAVVRSARWSGDTFTHGSDLYFYTNPSVRDNADPTVRMCITDEGRVGIGTTSPAGKLDVAGSNGTISINTIGDEINYSRNGTNYLTAAGANATMQIQASGASGTLAFATAGSERARIDSSGRLGLGTSSPVVKLHVSNGYSAATSLDGSLVQLISNNAATGNYAGLGLLGGNTGGSFIHFGDTDNAGIGRIGYFHSDNSFRINTNGSEAIRIDSSQRVGIGTTSPSQRLHVAGGNGSGNTTIGCYGGTSAGDYGLLILGTGSTDKASVNVDATNNDLRIDLRGNDGAFKFVSGASYTERARIDSSGRLLVGTSSGNSLFNGGTQNPQFQIEGTTGSTSIASLTANRNDAAGPTFYLAHSRGTAAGGTTVLQSGDQLGILAFAGTDGTDYVTGAFITANVDGTPGANDMPGRLVFSTTADGASSPTERMRIDSSGRVGIGTTSPLYRLHIADGGSTWFLRDNNDDAEMLFVAEAGQQAAIYFGDTVDNVRGGIVYDSTDDSLRLQGYNNSERARIDSSGRLLVGTSSARSELALGVQVEGTYSNAGLVRNATGVTQAPAFSLSRSRGSTSGAVTAVQNGDALGFINFHGANGTDLSNQGASISAYVDGDPFTSGDTTDLPGRLVFSTTADGASSPTERMRIDSSGRVGIGTTSVGNTLHVYSTAATDAAQIQSSQNFSTLKFVSALNTNSVTIGTDGAGNAQVENKDTSKGIVFTTGGGEAARIDSSKRLLIGTSTARANFYNTTASAGFQLEGTGTNRRAAIIGDDFEGALILASQKSGAVGGNTVLASGDPIGAVSFQGSDGTEFVEAATITAAVDGTPGANDMPGRLVFSTTADGANSPTERARIDNLGYLTGTVNALSRGLYQSQQYFRLNADLAGSDVDTAQSIFGVGVTLVGSTVYEFEMVYTLSKTAGTTSHTIGVGFGGTATLNNIFYELVGCNAVAAFPSVSDPDVFNVVQTANNTTMTAAGIAATRNFRVIVKGTVSVNAGGTFIPQYTLSAAPGGAYSTLAGSFVKISPLGASGANTSIGSWA